MCGILLVKGKITRKEVEECFQRIKYRGPDNTSVVEHDDMYFCHHRLSIINPNDESGNQPFDRDGMILICNGEIYNYLELQQEHFPDKSIKNDCEIIIDLYQKFGIEKTMELLDGDYAFALYDKEKDCLITGRDPIGLKPLFMGYDSSGELICLSSEIKAIVGMTDKIVPHPIGSYSVGGKEFQEFFVYYDEVVGALADESEACQQVRELLSNAIRKRITHTDREYAFLCSGGIDSSLILAIALEILNKENIHVFSVEYDDGSISYDSFYAKLLTDVYQVKHTIVKYKKEEALGVLGEVINRIESYDINTIRASVPMYLLAKWISQNTDYKVILSGEGADEIFMGYSYFNYCQGGEDAVQESLRLTKNLYSFDVLRAERCFSAHGLELRVPFLDRDLLKYVLSLDGELRLPRGGVEKYLLRESFRGLKKMPGQVLDRQKERFSDGVGFTWVPTLIRHADQTVDSIEMGDKYNYYNEPKNKEEFYYRNIFEKYYQGRGEVIKKREMPAWIEKVNQQAKASSLLAI